MLGLRPGLGLDLIDPALSVAQRHLGWGVKRLEDERRRYLMETERLCVPDF
jgi:hypothetical protein